MNENDKGLGSTSKFEVVCIVLNDGEFAIAEGYWNGETTTSFACRWHAQGESCGYPQTFGKPQWMLLPTVRVSKLTNAQVNNTDKPSLLVEF